MNFSSPPFLSLVFYSFTQSGCCCLLSLGQSKSQEANAWLSRQAPHVVDVPAAQVENCWPQPKAPPEYRLGPLCSLCAWKPKQAPLERWECYFTLHWSERVSRVCSHSTEALGRTLTRNTNITTACWLRSGKLPSATGILQSEDTTRTFGLFRVKAKKRGKWAKGTKNPE